MLPGREEPAHLWVGIGFAYLLLVLIPEICPVCLSSHLWSYGLMQARLEQERTVLSAHDPPTTTTPVTVRSAALL